ncbi:hypothetical protein BJV78DRAFT_1158994 [Lactifluus subvellereus]|nr:hypothetical protein BJV78DRAFT_1158994 [Lactifluus subvellereus]
MSGGPRAKGLWEFCGVQEGAHKRCGLRTGGGLVVWFSPDDREFGNAQRSTAKDGGCASWCSALNSTCEQRVEGLWKCCGVQEGAHKRCGLHDGQHSRKSQQQTACDATNSGIPALYKARPEPRQAVSRLKPWLTRTSL